MRKMSISNLHSGMILGRTLFSINGHVLLSAGAELNQTYIKRLQALGFTSVPVKEHFCDGLIFKDPVSEKARIDGVVTLKDIFAEAQKYKRLDTKAVKTLVNRLVDEIMQNRYLLFETPDIRTYDGYVYAHCINVCIMALRVGIYLNYNEFQLRDLGVGAILHDIGVVFVDQRVVEKAGPLVSAEMEQIQLHSINGFNLLREQNDINLLSAHVAFQHHERIDGSGYPRNMKSTEICEFARIVAIADAFDAMTNERKHRKGFSFKAAADNLRSEAGVRLDSELTELFLKNVATYPTGSLVSLNTGELGVVVSNSRNHISRPVVRILADSENRIVAPTTTKEVDLRLEKELQITNIIEDDNQIISSVCQAYDNRQRAV